MNEINIKYRDPSVLMSDDFSNDKSKHVLQKLKEIEVIVLKNLKYFAEDNECSSLIKDIFLKDVMNKTNKLVKDYNLALSKLSWIETLGFEKKEKVDEAYVRIENLLYPSKLPFSCEFTEITRYLKISEIATLARLNRQGRSLAFNAFLIRSKQYGFEKNDVFEAIDYLKQYFKVFHQEINSEGKDPEMLFQKLKSNNTYNIFNILSKKAFYKLPINWSSFCKTYDYPMETGYFDEETRLSGSQALIRAVRNGQDCIVKFLLRLGSDPLIPYENGSYPLHFAAQNGSFRKVEILLKYGAKIDERGVGGRTALMFACEEPHINVITFLIEKNADLNVRDFAGDTALCKALNHKDLSLILLLTNNGASL